MKTYFQIRGELHRLKQAIEVLKENDLPKLKDWCGADVVITGLATQDQKTWLADQPVVISKQKTPPRRRLVVTKYHQELSWLFNQLRDLFGGHIDYITKYDFYGTLADKALTVHSPDSKEILIAVIDAASEFLEQMNKAELFNKN
ncbi:MAG: hypothetical protein ABIJ04_00770 [Bacteroidota bacterium]